MRFRASSVPGAKPGAGSGIARVDHDDSAAAHVVVQRGGLRAGQVRGVGGDRPVQQGIQAQVGLAGLHRIGFEQGRGGAGVDVFGQSLQPGLGDAVHLRVAG